MPTPENLPDEIAALKRIITAMARDVATAQAEIAKLKFQLARYRRAEFGRSSEKLAQESEQLELAIETLETDQAERLASVAPEAAIVEGIIAAQSRPGGRCRITRRARRSGIAPARPAQAAAARCGASART